MPTTRTEQKLRCYHCGETATSTHIHIEEKIFCCDGCKMVYEILNEHALCNYYSLNDKPGINQRARQGGDKFAFLDDPDIETKLISFTDGQQTHVTFYLPQMHCSSCLYLLENLNRLETGVISCKVNFTRKEADIVFTRSATSLRKVAEILTAIGYEPYISLQDITAKRPSINKTMVYQLGIAGFCFGNIMLMSFPEYLGIDASEEGLRGIFRWLNFGLAIPVFLYSALPFYESSYKSLRHKFLNIDAPIALAILITFIRSAYEVIAGTGGGYFDSMTGIVFFMLAGRIIQDRTYRQLSFERDYRSYFPLAVTVLKDKQGKPTLLPNIKPGDELLIHSQELIPADGILTRGKAFIDYSFVTGESMPVLKEVGELVYAGGKQTEGNIELLVVKEVAQSYLTKLWNREEFKEKEENPTSFVHLLSRYFTYIVLAIALATGIYWQFTDPARLWPAVSSVFIIACPCALLLSNSFTNGNILQILGRNRFYLRNAEIIERFAGIDQVVFDKTGTLTVPDEEVLEYHGKPLNRKQEEWLAAVASQSTHPLSRALAKHIYAPTGLEVTDLKEIPGKGLEAGVEGNRIRIGSAEFVNGSSVSEKNTRICFSINENFSGYYEVSNFYRHDLESLISSMKKDHEIAILSGDNDQEKDHLRKLLGPGSTIIFNQKPEDKLEYIRQLQRQGKKVMMIGDGLNDAGALKQSDVGIAVSGQVNNFTPSSDAIIAAAELGRLPRFIRLCKANRNIVMASFVLSIAYNIIGLMFAVQGDLSPLVAAILMPSSSLSILLLTFGSSSLMARLLGMK